jgi:integrase
MRRGEILSLEWDQIDFKAGEIRVENTKSGRRRTVEINSSLLEVLTRLKSQARDGRFVFPNPKTGMPFTKLQKSFQRACLKAEVLGLRFHDLRHTFASRLVEKGVDIVRVKELLGHSTVRITERYTHPSREERKKAVESLCRKAAEAAENRANLLHICDTAKEGKGFRRLISLFSVN